ncbi:Hypothetical predicted protein [Pelobates cultripes]|uniref:Uncharacterized protein n=1 Tax=Pelobates cultripes TaxID=61616 RepID=A0AAD1W1D8_PELCU|nr:Hypothetical predicted protein [Pelobates cultripes]
MGTIPRGRYPDTPFSVLIEKRKLAPIARKLREANIHYIWGMERYIPTEIRGESRTIISEDDLELFLQFAGLSDMPQQGISPPPTKKPEESESIDKCRHSMPPNNKAKRLTPLPRVTGP